MAGALIKYNGMYESNVSEFCVDTVAEVSLLPTTSTLGTGDFANIKAFQKTAGLGSTCIVGNGDNAVLTYMLFTAGWKAVE